jgi:hypothetical protein
MKHVPLSFLFILSLILVTGSHVFGYPPSSILGLSIESFLFPDTYDSIGNITLVKARALLSIREMIGDTGYFALLSQGEGGIMVILPNEWIDEELVDLEIGFDIDESRLVLNALFFSSFSGTEEVIPYYKPMWETIYYFSTKSRSIKPFLSYSGYYFTEPTGTEDRQFHGGTIGFEYKPSLFLGFTLSGGGGWEGWFESPVLDEAGDATGDTRNDYILTAAAGAEGFIGFFIDWNAVLGCEMRWSTGNIYDAGHAALIEKSEEKLKITLDGSLGWSPSRHINVEVMPELEQEIYFSRPALDEHDQYTGEKVMNTLCRGTLHIDWTPDNRFYFVCEIKGERIFSTHDEYNTWNAGIEAGIEYSFPLSED